MMNTGIGDVNLPNTTRPDPCVPVSCNLVTFVLLPPRACEKLSVEALDLREGGRGQEYLRSESYVPQLNGCKGLGLGFHKLLTY